MSSTSYTHFADLVTRNGARARFHWSKDQDSVLIIATDPAGDIDSTETFSRDKARGLWGWLINAGWET